MYINKSISECLIQCKKNMEAHPLRAISIFEKCERDINQKTAAAEAMYWSLYGKAYKSCSALELLQGKSPQEQIGLLEKSLNGLVEGFHQEGIDTSPCY